MKNPVFFSLFFLLALSVVSCQNDQVITPKMDEYYYDGNKLKIYFFGHASLMLDFNGTIIHVDPVKNYADYTQQPKADIILVTHEHGDHLDVDSINKITKDKTKLFVTQSTFDKLKRGTVIANGQTVDADKMKITAVPAYNMSKDREKYHPKGRDNGYVLGLGNKRVYIAGDTEDIPELADLKNIDIAFLPMNLPYTMAPEQVANAAKMFSPKILYPYHFGESDVSRLENLMKGVKGIELRIKDLK